LKKLKENPFNLIKIPISPGIKTQYETLLLPVALVDKSKEKTKPQTTALSLLTFACDNETHFFWI
jgi:hypothetical protein